MTSPNNARNHLERYEEFMATVRAACATPEGRVAIRQGLTDNFADPWRMHMHLLAHGAIPTAQHRDAEYPFLLVAALWATHDAPNPRMNSRWPAPEPPPANPGHNLGWSLARAERAGVFTRQSATGQLTSLSMRDAPGLYQAIPGLVALLRDNNIPISWPVLLSDLTRWERWGDEVRVRWARQYHHTLNEKKASR
ncbi:type I-E CRISPR-associated protein Cse2/CasB [Streptomyces sedi]|uniref:Type I-E CRISPR-associated protein Cse2/CasB n=1 Tax=Streptomyces sedi TaxID=555059 RepID=A0A5C4UTT2_9ACTN|nr:type I-E CRISPR-associated protein Cse2/CasB [Streptomyces sedi]TNM27064.1 type I-E CRISPR-associated protein Cse2/CasB [Streptomyces sedi]